MLLNALSPRLYATPATSLTASALLLGAVSTLLAIVLMSDRDDGVWDCPTSSPPYTLPSTPTAVSSSIAVARIGVKLDSAVVRDEETAVGWRAMYREG